MKIYKLAIMYGIFIILFSITSLAQGVNSSTIGKQAIYTKNAPAPIGAYSQAVKIGSTIYISGQIPIDNQTGELVEGDFNHQFRQAISNLSEIIRSAGGTLNDLVKVTIYVTDLANFAVLNQVMAEYFHQPYPARVVIEVRGLPKHAAVEIEAIMEKNT